MHLQARAKAVDPRMWIQGEVQNGRAVVEEGGRCFFFFFGGCHQDIKKEPRAIYFIVPFQNLSDLRTI